MAGGRQAYLSCIASVAADQAAVGEGLLWMMVVLFLTVLVVAVLGYFRKRFRAPKEAGGSGFTLEELRRLRDFGSVTESEYEALKRNAIKELQGSKQGGS
jgi:hypothetical protein